MKWFRMMMVFAVALVSCSVASAQAPDPVPDPEFGQQVCDGIMDAIANAQAEYAAKEAEIDALDAEIADIQALIAEIQANPSLPPEEKEVLIASCNRDIIVLQAKIMLAEIALDALAEVISGLWNSYFACGCDD